jgi:uncharacterized membrane protein YeaQ/YmgE (transglycosylase-associated protein family)
MQRIGAPSLISFTGSIFRVFVGALVAGLLLPTIGIVFGGGIIAVVVNALIGACGIFFSYSPRRSALRAQLLLSWSGN